jgi:hypothetical protein
LAHRIAARGRFREQLEVVADGRVFFPERSARAGPTDAVSGPVLQVSVKFLASPSDGIDVEAGNEGEQGIAAIAGLFGLQSNEPAALLLVQATYDKVNLMMELSIGVLMTALAVRASTGTNDAVGHDETSGK